VTAVWIGSASIVTDTAIKLAGEALNGTYGISDFNPDANAEAKAFSQLYRDKYKLEPDVYSSWAFDAMNLLATSITNAKSTKPDDIRKAILALREHKGVEGNYRFDQNGDGLAGYNVVKNSNSKFVFVKHIEFPH
jgi:branched-chain amino acid transport system substrate-binding protein